MAAAQSQSALNALPRISLLIGNSKYAEAPLKNPGNDAKAIAGELLKLGFQVDLKVDAGRNEMLEAIRGFGRELAKRKSVGLFYYAGHGAQLAWRNYLIPVNAVIEQVADMQTQAVDVVTLLEGLIKAGNPMNVVILDACRDNPFVDGKGRGLGGTRGLARVEPPSGTFVMFSAGAGETALDRLSDDDSDPNSVYTRTLLPSLQTPGKSITEIARDVRRGVRDLANKVNHVQTPAYYDEVVGDFCPAGCEAKVAKLEPPHAPPAPPLTTPAVPQAKAIKGDFAGAPKQPARLELALVADDPAKASGPPLHDFVHVDTTYGIEQDVTLPGDIESFAATTDERSVPAIKLVLAASALDRINRAADLVDRRIALVLDGRTVLAVATLREPLSTELLLTGDFSLNDVRRLADAISANPSGIH